MSATVRQTKGTITPFSEAASVDPIVTKLGAQVVCSFWEYMALLGKIYQVRAGTITTPLVGDVVLTDQAAEMAVNAISGGLVVPAEFQVSVRLSTGTLHEYAIKSVLGASNTGAFVPLVLRTDNGTAATAPAFVAAAGGVATPAELATTTRRHWEHANPVAAGAGNDPGMAHIAWTPLRPPIITSGYTIYVQIAATTTGPSYYAHLDFLDDPTSSLL